jgi:ligand-binding sensor domain-containing protein
LSNNVIRSLEQDDYGLIYIGTNNGLNVLDGNNLNTIDLPKAVNHEPIFRLKKLSGNRIWINHTDCRNVFWLYKGAIISENISNKIQINNFYENFSNEPWLCNDEGIFKVKGTGLEKLPINFPTKESIVHFIFKVNDTLLLIGSKGLPISLMHTNTNKIIAQSTDPISFNDITSDFNGNYFIASDSRGLFILEKGSLEKGIFKELPLPPSLQFLAKEDINQLVYDEKEQVHYIATKNFGLIQYFNNGSIKVINTENGLSSNHVISLLIDKENNKWIGTNKGLNKLSNTNYEFFDGVSGMDKGSIYLTEKDQQGRVFIFGSETIRFIDIAGKRGVLTYPSIVEKLTLFTYATSKGIFVFTPQVLFFINTTTSTPIIQNIQTLPIKYRRMVALSNEEYLIGGVNQLSIYNNGKITPLTDTIVDIRDIFKDQYNNVWVATHNRGLYRIQLNKKRGSWNYSMLQHLYNSKKTNNRFLNLTKIDSNFLYAATRFEGIRVFKYDEKQFQELNPITTNEGLNNNAIKHIVQDGDGNIWVATNTGINKIIRQKGKLLVVDLNTTYQLSNTVNHILINKGAIFGSTDIGLFKITNFKKSIPNLTIFIKEIIFPSKTIPLYSKDTTIQLKRNENTFSVSFASPFYSNEYAIKYYYRLSQQDSSNWIAIKSNQNITINTENSGTHFLQIKAVSENEEITVVASLKFIIATPFWKKWWFIPLLAIVFTGAVIFIARQRVKQIKKAEVIKTDFNKQIADLETRAIRSQMNPFFVVNSLNKLQKYILQKDTDAANAYLMKLNQYIKVNLQYSQEKSISLIQEIEGINLFLTLEKNRNNEKFEYSVTVAEDIRQTKTFIPSLLLQPYLQNAIWHGILNKEEHGFIAIDFRKTATHLICTIDDDGIGRLNGKTALIQRQNELNFEDLKMFTTINEAANEYAVQNIAIKTMDKLDSSGLPLGTTVVIEIPLYKTIGVV